MFEDIQEVQISCIIGDAKTRQQIRQSLSILANGSFILLHECQPLMLRFAFSRLDPTITKNKTQREIPAAHTEQRTRLT
jgi:hypothetical protein